MTQPDQTKRYVLTILGAIQREHQSVVVTDLLDALAEVAGHTLALAGEKRVPASFAARAEGTRAQHAEALKARTAQEAEG